MAGAYLANNLIVNAATIAASSADTAYPIANLCDYIGANVMRATSKTTLVLTIDLGAAAPADSIALINHNLTAGSSISLKAGNSPNPSTVVASPTYRVHDLWKAFTLTTARYWTVTISDNNPVNLQIGELLLGARVALPRGRRIGNYSPATKRAAITGETYAGVIHSYHLFERKQFNPIFRVASAAELAVFQTLDALTYGNLYPFLFVPDGSGVDCYYVRKEPDFEPSEIGRLTGPEIAHDYQMILIEESRGLEVLA
jgi:hypothetical protein